jgi:transglutaminase/protease-like cytokinesis protein 3
MFDALIASPSHPKPYRHSTVESFYFLTLPIHLLYTHIPIDPKQQFGTIVDHRILLKLPFTCPAYFINKIRLKPDFDLSHCTAVNAEPLSIDIVVPKTVECIAEIVTNDTLLGPEGDAIDGPQRTERALAQVTWENNQRIARIKAFLPRETGTLKIYAGPRAILVYHTVRTLN